MQTDGNTISAMANKGALQAFERKKVIVIKDLTEILKKSVRTAHSRLKQWGAINSYNMNGCYYTLPSIARFDQFGLWHYRDIHFSKYGNLKETLISLVENSENGLDSNQIGQLLKLDSRSFLSHFNNIKQLYREKINGRFIYFATDKVVYQQQKQKRTVQKSGKQFNSVKDSTGILLLVERIKNPDLDEADLAKHLRKQGVRIKPEAISNFFFSHGIKKKR